MVIGLETQTLHCITREELLFNTRLLNSWSKASIFVISLHLPLTTTIGKINPQLYVLLLINSQLYICSKSSISFLPTSLMCPKRVMHESVSDIILLYVCRFLTRDGKKNTHTNEPISRISNQMLLQFHNLHGPRSGNGHC